MTTSINRTCHAALWVPLALLVASIPANAAQFGLFDNSVAAIWKTTLTVGAGWRNANPQCDLVGAGATAKTAAFANGEFLCATGAVGVNDDAELNFPHSGDMFSAPLTLVSELSLVHINSGQGVFVRVRGWYDLFLEGTNVAHGNGANAYTPHSRLSDKGFKGAAAFDGADFYDAYYFGNFTTGAANWQIRLGRQAIDWGEGIFYPGINFAVNPYDYAWLSMVGAPLLNGGKLPVNRVYANVALPGGWTLDGFFNLEWRTSVFPGCGTYFSGLDNGVNPGCNSPTVAGFPDTVFIGTRNYYNGVLPPIGYFAGGAPNPALDSRRMTGEPSKWSGWGLSAHTFIEKLATELGFYYTNYVSQTFVNAAVIDANPADFSINTMWPKQRLESYALSASTGWRSLVLSGQVTETRNFATHYNAPDYIIGANAGIGPLGFMHDQCLKLNGPGGGECQTYYPTNITQLQLGGTWQFGDRVGLADATLTGETVMVWATNLPPADGPDSLRLGRYGNFGESSWTPNSVGYVCNPGPLPPNGVRNKCLNSGYTTPFAWGYKLRLASSFPTSPALTFVPALTFAHDVVGFTPDQATVVGGRMSFAANLRTVMYQNYYVDLGALWYKRNSAWDPLRDRGQYTAAFGMNIN